MFRTCRGFSLIEAMVSALVLSIGLLGLAQLQVRLQISAQQGSEYMYASMMSAGFYERFATYGLSPVADAPLADTLRVGPSARYTVTHSVSRTVRTSRNRTMIQWSIPEGTAEISTTGLFDRRASGFESRWLLQ